MIISASRRTDIPAFYPDWLLRRLEDGQVLVPNPWNPNQVSRITLSPENVDCIIFWTKNPGPMFDKLNRIDRLGYRYYFTFTVTGYGTDLERNLPPKGETINTFRKLADRIGPMRVDWRFDPIIVNENYSVQWHFDVFGELCREIGPSTERCIINFVKFYPHIKPKITELDDEVIKKTATGLAKIAAEHHVPIFNCTEKWNLHDAGIGYSSCIDRTKIERILGKPIKAKKDPGQPNICRCIESVDIGMYSTCLNGCTYCYAMSSEKTVRRRMTEHDPDSPLLTGWPTGMEKITDRTKPSLVDEQSRLF